MKLEVIFLLQHSLFEQKYTVNFWMKFLVFTFDLLSLPIDGRCVLLYLNLNPCLDKAHDTIFLWFNSERNMTKYFVNF